MGVMRAEGLYSALMGERQVQFACWRSAGPWRDTQEIEEALVVCLWPVKVHLLWLMNLCSWQSSSLGKPASRQLRGRAEELFPVFAVFQVLSMPN